MVRLPDLDATAVGGTTITEPDSLEPAGTSSMLALCWCFPAEAPAHIPLDAGRRRVHLGRDPSCEAQLNGTEVSRRHAVLTLNANGATITDLDSHNGTRVNGNRVDSVPLLTGDVVRVGSFVGVVTRSPGKVKELAPGLRGGALLEEALMPLKQAATSELPVILEGETGTGKEVVASSLHHWSGRKGRFIAVNCAALPEGLAEAELFGYRRGAFTGADKAQAGLFRDAQHGTLLLDEVSDLPLGVQAKLLRVLEQREVMPLGETQPVKIDVRIVVAGQESLLNAVQAGRFRADLLARLEGVTLKLPALRQRKEDVPGLFIQLLAEHWAPPPEVSVDLIERLCIHDWPFNVRELVNLVKKLVVFHGGLGKLTARQLPDRIRLGKTPCPTLTPAEAPAATPKRATLEDLMGALQQAGGNVTQAARMLGITRQRAYRLLEAGGVDLTALRLDDPPAHLIVRGRPRSPAALLVSG